MDPFWKLSAFVLVALTLGAAKTARRADAAEPAQPVDGPAYKPSRPGTLQAQADQIVADFLYREKIGGIRGNPRFF